MRLLLTIPHFDAAEGGAESFAVTVCRELSRRGHAVRVLAGTGRSGHGVELVLGNLSEAPRHVAEFAADFHLDWGLNVPADLHRLGGGTHREYLRLIGESRSPVLRFLRGITDACRRRHYCLLQDEFGMLARPGTHVLANSAFVAAQVRATAPVPEDHIHTLLNGVDTERFSAERLRRVRETRRAELGLGPGDVAFLMVAHNLRLKNFALLARVLPRIAGGCPQVKLVVMGKRPPPFSAPWLVYAGRYTVPEEIFVACDVLVHPTFFDACANVVIEAMAAGLPVLTSERNGSAELVEPEGSGRILPVVGDRAEVESVWANAMLELASSPGLRSEWGRRGRGIAEKQSIVGYTERLVGLLEDLSSRKEALASHPAAPPPSLRIADAWVRYAARITVDAVVWESAEEADAAEAAWLRGTGSLADARLVGTGRNHFSLYTAGVCGGVLLKVYFAREGGCSPTRVAAEEFRVGRAALAGGIPAAEPLAWGQAPGFGLLAVRSVPGAVPLSKFAGRPPDAALLDAVCQMVGRLLGAGLQHPRLESRHILVRPVQDAMQLVLADFHGARVGEPFSSDRAADLLGWAIPFFQHLQAGEREERFAAAVRSTPGSALTWHGLERQWVEKAKGRWRRRFWAGLFRRSGRTVPGIACVNAAGADPVLLEELAAAARRGGEGVSVLKHDIKRQLWRVKHGDGCYVVKRYVRGTAFGKVNRGRQAWQAAALLRFLHIDSAPCLGLLSDANKDCYLIMEDAGEADVHTFLKAHSQDALLSRRVLSLSAAYLALLHRRGVWHRDMKCSNLVVVGHADRVLLCDLEDTSLRLNVSDRMVVRSLVQFLAYVPSSVPPCQRIRFFAVYARETGMSRASFRRLYGLLKRVGGERVWNGS